jgi:anaerobic dimethyl sulfoxide reductase subunit A
VSKKKKCLNEYNAGMIYMSKTKIIPTCCPHDCGGKCLLLVHLQNGKIEKTTTVRDPQLRACPRGLFYHKRVYAPDRLKYPLRRVGERGKGDFERISWDKALDLVAREMKRIKLSYGNSRFLLYGWSGNTGQLHGTWKTSADRLFNMFGGKTEVWSTTSFEGAIFASKYMFGSNSRLIIMWGWNPVDTIQGTGTSWYVRQAKKTGCKIVCIDPIFTNTAKVYADHWIPIKPGSDTAMMMGMAYVMIDEGLHDSTYLRTYTTGFEKFEEYVTGKEDSTPKTPVWAESITGVPASTITNLAREYANTKPAALIHGYGPGRTAFGEEYHRTAITLQAMTGNIGIQGGYSGTLCGYPINIGIFPVCKNPVETSIKTDKWADCILLGKAGGYPNDVKMLYVVGGNPLNQIENINKGVKALRKLDFIVVHEQFMTPTAKFADILLPVNTHFEKNDTFVPAMKGHYVLYNNKVIDSMYESMSDLEIFTLLAKKLGISGFNPKTEEEWLKDFISESNIPDYEKLKKRGFYKFELSEPWIAFKEQIRDPKENPFPTPSGKIEIYSETLARMNFKKSKYGSNIPPFPQFIESWENNKDPLVKKYPLQLITPHFKYRANTVFYNTQDLRKLYKHEIWINPKDAKLRNIQNEDIVIVFNERGSVQIAAKVTDRIMSGVVSIFQGTYYQPDDKGLDKGGSANVLTKDAPSPSGAFPYNTSLVQMKKFECMHAEK